MMSKHKNTIHGWINLNKPLGITSAAAVNKAKWLLKPSKIGHAGTLDPLATGVLPLALGEGTKCVNLLMDAKKTYEFSVTFGERRSTEDAEGEVIATSDKMPTEDEIRAILPCFTGEISQLPPIYSALKVDGKRAYDLARAGQEVVLEKRLVTVHALEFFGFEAETGSGGKPSSLGGEGLDEGTGHLRSHLYLAQEQQATDRAQAMRRVSTEAEQRVWGVLRDRRLDGLKFRRQHSFGHYIADFICLDQHVVIEVDGGLHGTTEVYDVKRTAYFKSQGFRVLRFWNNEVMGNLEGVVAMIRSEISRTLTQPSPPRGEGLPASPSQLNKLHSAVLKDAKTVHFRAIVSKGTYIRSLGRDMAQACGSEGYISRLHRAAVGPFTDAEAISLDFLAESVHKAPPPEGNSRWLTPLERALDDIPALLLEREQLETLCHGQRVTLANHHPDTQQLALLFEGKLVGLARVEGNQVISNRLLNI